MPKYEVEATRTHAYKVSVDADNEADALDLVRDWLAEDWETFEVHAQWDFEARGGEQ
jgi:hypothetical protein